MAQKNINHERKRKMPLLDKDCDNILVDEIIEMTGDNTKKDYPGELRRLAILDQDHNDIVEV